MFIVLLLPTIVAFWRHHPNRWVILALNFFLGATGIVWFGCLIWAFMAVHVTKDPDGTNGGESGLNLIANDVVRVRVEERSPPALPTALQPPVLPTGDVLERLERLKKLFDDGVVDKDQFQRLRVGIVSNSS